MKNKKISRYTAPYRYFPSIVFLTVIGLVMLVILTLYVQQPQLLTSRAVTPNPVINLPPPYLRLVIGNQRFEPNRKAAVEVYLHTGGIPTVEADLVITYDPGVLEISADDIAATDVYPVINVESVGSGRIILSLFTAGAAGYSPVAVTEEVRIATLFFSAVSKETQSTSVVLVGQGETDEQSHIYRARLEQEGNLIDVLRSTAGVSVSVGR